jgi:hypothetical protein
MLDLPHAACTIFPKPAAWISINTPALPANLKNSLRFIIVSSVVENFNLVSVLRIQLQPYIAPINSVSPAA